MSNFGNDFARNFVIFGVDNSSSSHTNNWKNVFLVLGEGPTDDINGSIGAAQKRFSINLSTVKAQFCSSLHYNDDDSYLFVKGKEIYNKSKAVNNNLNFPNQFLSRKHLISLTRLKKYL